MKKIFLFLLLFLTVNFCHAEALKASLSYDETIKSFFGTWHVTSKIESATNYSLFNKLSVDIWNLSGYGNVLILENALTGAKSSIQTTTSEDLDGKHLKFTRIKEFKEGNFKYKHTETPEFTLKGDVFKGFDTFTVEKFDNEGHQISVDVVKYKVVGQKIAGD